MEPPIKLELFAQIKAEIDAGASLDDVIEREKVSPEAWANAEKIWVARMNEEAEQKRFVLTNRYKTAFTTKRRLLAARRPPPAEAAPAAQPPQAAPVPPKPPAAPEPPKRSEPPVVMGGALAQPVFAPPPAVASPWAPRAAAREPVAAPPGAVPAPAPPTTVQGPPSPVAPPPVVRPSAPSPPSPLDAPVDPGATMDLDGMALRAAVLPFQKGSAAVGARDAGSPPAARPNMPNLRATLEGGQVSPLVLPFAGKGTRDLGAAPPPPPAVGATPFRAGVASDTSPPAESGRFTIEQFASLTAEIAATPARVGEIRARYGLDEASHRAEAQRWQRRFASDEPLFAKYAALYKSYRDWLARGPK